MVNAANPRAATAGDSGAAYVFNDLPSVLEIPALGAPGLGVLVLALATAGLLGLRRRQRSALPPERLFP